MTYEKIPSFFWRFSFGENIGSGSNCIFGYKDRMSFVLSLILLLVLLLLAFVIVFSSRKKVLLRRLHPPEQDTQLHSLKRSDLKTEKEVPSDCYLHPGICPFDSFCLLEDRQRWEAKEQPTRGRCVPYQKECYSCQPTQEDELLYPDRVPALSSRSYDKNGQFISRPLVCGPGLICTGDLIPTLPPTCVQRRPRDRLSPPTQDELYQWARRFVRLGGKKCQDQACKNHAKLSNVSPETKSARREDLTQTANNMLRVLWPAIFAPYKDILPGVDDKSVLSCDDPVYLSQLSDEQKEKGGPDYRAPIPKEDKSDAPPCIWTSVDFAYNDEGPAIWSLLHTLTANLPEQITSSQKEMLRMIPMYLRLVMSCGWCRSFFRPSLIDIGIPDSSNGIDWFKYFWRAHNYVNEHASHTRCGENTSCGTSWEYFSSECAGKYKFPWFMSLSDAYQQWHILSPVKNDVS